MTGHTGGIESMAFSRDGYTLAAGSDDNTVRLWDVATHSRRSQPLNVENVEAAVAFGPDSHTLATGSVDGAQLWKVPSTAHLDSMLCARVGRSLTRDEWARYGSPRLPYQQICP